MINQREICQNQLLREEGANSNEQRQGGLQFKSYPCLPWKSILPGFLGLEMKAKIYHDSISLEETTFAASNIVSIVCFQLFFFFLILLQFCVICVVTARVMSSHCSI